MKFKNVLPLAATVMIVLGTVTSNNTYAGAHASKHKRALEVPNPLYEKLLKEAEEDEKFLYSEEIQQQKEPEVVLAMAAKRPGFSERVNIFTKFIKNLGRGKRKAADNQQFQMEYVNPYYAGTTTKVDEGKISKLKSLYQELDPATYGEPTILPPDDSQNGYFEVGSSTPVDRKKKNQGTTYLYGNDSQNGYFEVGSSIPVDRSKKKQETSFRDMGTYIDVQTDSGTNCANSLSYLSIDNASVGKAQASVQKVVQSLENSKLKNINERILNVVTMNKYGILIPNIGTPDKVLSIIKDKVLPVYNEIITSKKERENNKVLIRETVLSAVNMLFLGRGATIRNSNGKGWQDGWMQTNRNPQKSGLAQFNEIIAMNLLDQEGLDTLKNFITTVDLDNPMFKIGLGFPPSTQFIVSTSATKQAFLDSVKNAKVNSQF